MGTPLHFIPPLANVALGRYGGAKVQHKFGRNVDIDTASDPEDLWDGGGVWVAPLAPRIHALVSTLAGDSVGGGGTEVVRVVGLSAWDGREIEELVTLAGLTPVNTVNEYAIIYRMQVRGGATNLGDITATAAVDGTLTAQITAGLGQTLMAIYGIPEGENFLLTSWYASLARSNQNTSADLSLLVNPDPVVFPDLFNIRQPFSLAGSGTSHFSHDFTPHLPIPGPALIVVHVEQVGGNDTAVGGGFDGYHVDK